MSRSFTALAGVLLLAVGIALLAGSTLPRGGSVAPLALPSALATATPPAPTSSTGATATAPTIGPIPDGYRVQMPRLGIDLPIAEGNIDVDEIGRAHV